MHAQDARWKALADAAQKTLQLGRHNEAEQLLRQALRIAESFREDDPRRATTAEQLGQLLFVGGRYLDAEACLRAALAAFEKARGPNCREAGVVLNGLGAICGRLGRFADAEQVFRRSLAILEKALPPTDPVLGEVLANLGTLYFDTERYGEVEPLLLRALAATEKNLDRAAQRTFARSLELLGHLYHKQGNDGQAEALLRRSRALQKQLAEPANRAGVPGRVEPVKVRPQVVPPLPAPPATLPAPGKKATANVFFVAPTAPAARTRSGPGNGTSWRDLITTGIKAQQADLFDEAELNFLAALQRAEEGEPADGRLVYTLNQLASLLTLQARNAEAEKLCRRALAVAEKHLAADHVELSRSLNQLGVACRLLGRHSEAESLFQRGLSLAEKPDGPGQALRPAYLTNLGFLAMLQGNYDQARAFHHQAQLIAEKSQGANHPDLAGYLGNLGCVARAEGKYAEAEALHQKALALSNQPPRPANLAQSAHLHNLAETYRAWGKYAEAEPFFQQALAIRERVLKPGHPKLVETLTACADVLGKLNREAESAPPKERPLGARADASSAPRRQTEPLAVEVPPTPADRWQARLRDAARARLDGNTLQAEQELLAALDEAERLHLPEGWLTDNLKPLIDLYQANAKYPQAAALYRRALSVCAKIKGKDNPEVAALATALARFHFGRGEHDQAEPLFQQAIAVLDKHRGLRPELAGACYGLGVVYHFQGKYNVAKPLLRRALRIREKMLGPEHRDVAASLHALAEMYVGEGKTSSAEPLYRRALHIRMKREDVDTLDSLYSLGLLYYGKEEYARAEPLYQQALALADRVLGPNHLRVAQLLDSYAALLHEQQRAGEAAALEARAASIRAANVKSKPEGSLPPPKAADGLS